MSLIDASYFVNELDIPGQSNTVDSTGSALSSFIVKYETRYLKELLGLELYAEFQAGLLVDPIEQKWIDLRNALRNETTKESPIANYVYYWWMRNNVSHTASIGEVVPVAENSQRTSPVGKMVRAWNEMVNLNREIVPTMDANYLSYTPIYGWQNGWYLDGQYWGVHNPEIFYYQNTLNL